MESHVGKPLCFYPTIQNIILPQIALAQERKDAKKGDHDVLETQEGRPRCFRNPCTSQRKTYNRDNRKPYPESLPKSILKTISRSLILERCSSNLDPLDFDAWSLGSHGPKYYTTSDWLGQEKLKKPREGRQRCFGIP